MRHSLSDHHGPRLVLITNGMRPLSQQFSRLPGQPIGIVSWYGESSGRWVDALASVPLLARFYAFLRRRQYASLAHLCGENHLKYASLHKSRSDLLEFTLSQWRADLVITSGCPMVPVAALNGVRHGGFNLHPSLLPAYRGADPVAWQVIDQLSHMGVTVHRLNERYDEGDILAQTTLRRESGQSKRNLMQQLEGVAGHSLLNMLIEKLVNGEVLDAHPQPRFSPTRTAGRLSLQIVGSNWSLNDFTAEAAWDVLRFYDQCPPQWLALTGWRKLRKWRPVSITYTECRDTHKAPARWCVEHSGLEILLVHPSAVIELRGFPGHCQLST